jgi:hypothetical protein
MPTEDLLAQIMARRPVPLLRAARFTIDDRILCDGYTYGHTWNGWACPYFEKEAALRMLDDWNAAGADGIWASYDALNDTFEFHDDGAQDYYETFSGETHLVDGQPMTLYPIGTGCWIWDEIREGRWDECS